MMPENTAMMDNVIAWLIGLRKNDWHFTKDFGERICKEALQFVHKRTCFELICVQLLKHAPREWAGCRQENAPGNNRDI
jgi:hypothetical protein